jgi:hypothetical protein
MPLKLTVGLAKKVGRPDYGSLGASCGMEIELAADAIRGDPEALLGGARAAFAACRRAVDEELARLQGPPPEHPGEAGVGVRTSDRVSLMDRDEQGPPAPPRDALAPDRPATAGQVRTIVAIARRRRLGLAGLLRAEFGVAGPEELSLPPGQPAHRRAQGGRRREVSPGGPRRAVKFEEETEAMTRDDDRERWIDALARRIRRHLRPSVDPEDGVATGARRTGRHPPGLEP